MNFKDLFLFIILMAIIMVMISCSSDGSGVARNSGRAKISINRETFVSSKKLPIGASRLYNLPSNVKGFVQRNYPGYIIMIAVSDPLCGDGDAVDVAISKIGSADLSLIFKPDGTFVQQEQNVPLHTAPIAIIQTLKALYSDYSVGGSIEKLTLADNSVEYNVDLSKGADSKEVIFDINGVVVCEN